jgi:hypothetical protein
MSAVDRYQSRIDASLSKRIFPDFAALPLSSFSSISVSLDQWRTANINPSVSTKIAPLAFDV